MYADIDIDVCTYICMYLGLTQDISQSTTHLRQSNPYVYVYRYRYRCVYIYMPVKRGNISQSTTHLRQSNRHSRDRYSRVTAISAQAVAPLPNGVRPRSARESLHRLGACT